MTLYKFSVLCLWLGLVTALKCPGGLVCDNEDHCCELPGGGYECCPQSKEHMRSFPMVQSGMLNEVTENLCLDHTSCPLEYSCMRTPAGSYGCCPVEEAVSCRDGNHCCPKGFLCSADGKSCIKRLDDLNLGAIICPDETSECPDESTCCQLPSGQWGCCPFSQAVCCSDKLHCCPHGTSCDVAHSQCLKGLSKTPMWSSFPATKRAHDVKYNATSSCPHLFTSCKGESGEETCCPLSKAVCCEDHTHCCPEGTTCDVKEGKCQHKVLAIPWFTKRPAGPVKKSLTTEEKSGERDVKCNDTVACPDGSTCCKVQSGDWACCPLAKAVCCEDHIHCCPEGTTCDVKEGKCQHKVLAIPWFTKRPAGPVKKSLTTEEKSGERDVKCNDTVACPDGSTCCKVQSGDWACCPLAKAVCCEDHTHCCPEGTTCDVKEGKCQHKVLAIPWFTKRPAGPVKKSLTTEEKSGERDVKCNDTVACPDGNTCCKMQSGDWGCCPAPNAVCCEDHIHCCPEGTTCDAKGEACNQNILVVPWLTKRPATPVKKSRTTEEKSMERDVKCNDTVACPDGNTCCKMQSGNWGCCPIAEAVCCADHIHCCPQGYTCETETCEKGKLSFPWMQKEPAITNKLPEEESAPSVMCDDQTECPVGNTCCKYSTGEWGCCPLSQAVCCSDHKHCCPTDYTCDLLHSTCSKGKIAIPWVSKTVARKMIRTSTDPLTVVTCDSHTRCPDRNTCCKLLTGKWACCPLPNAVCCEDHTHCCPQGYQCNVQAQTCESQDGVLFPWNIQKAPVHTFSTSEKNAGNDVKCDSKKSCAPHNTCCKKASGGWGCCLYEEAVCCEDQSHCCPKGYTCEVSAGLCLKKDGFYWDGLLSNRKRSFSTL
ncbi:progranulin [Latimeria chalumnae]|uniref:progranulin n=1 Tax=Latimeria chalumnae TaxID=7897 RepID=UPI00313B8DD3